jgi:hypothetical protein
MSARSSRGEQGYAAEAWYYLSRGLAVISAVEVVAPEPGAEVLGPEYHLSLSRTQPNGTPGRCSSADARWVLAQFGLEDAEEDNHVPRGKVRHFWRPVADRLSGYACHCKDREPAIIEDKGDYVWRGVTP